MYKKFTNYFSLHHPPHESSMNLISKNSECGKYEYYLACCAESNYKFIFILSGVKNDSWIYNLEIIVGLRYCNVFVPLFSTPFEVKVINIGDLWLLNCKNLFEVRMCSVTKIIKRSFDYSNSKKSLIFRIIPIN